MSETRGSNQLSPELQRQLPVPPYNEGQDTVLVVGAAGKFAGLVVPALAKRTVKVKAFIRDLEGTDAVPRTLRAYFEELAVTRFRSMRLRISAARRC